MTTGDTVDAASIRIGVYDGPRDALREFFAFAEDSESQLEDYLHDGRVLVARIGGHIAGHLQLVPTDNPAAVEIKNMAVAPRHRRRGVGSALISASRQDSMAGSAERLVVATAAADIDNLAFYQRNGFRFAHVERDAFTPATGYAAGIEINGIPLRDRVWLDLTIGRQS